MIKGGYVLQARKIESSEISHKSPHIREIFNWLYRNANYKDREQLKRGQLVCTYKDIQEGLSWYIGYRKEMYSKSQCETALKALKKATMITTTRTTRGMVVTICNYDFYQNPDNYENHTITTARSTREPHDLRHDTEESKNDKNDKNKEEGTPPKKKTTRFKPPTQEEVQAYADEKGLTIDAEKFCDYFISVGWTVGKSGKKMKDWKAAVRNWVRRNKEFSAEKSSSRPWERNEFDYPEGEEIISG